MANHEFLPGRPRHEQLSDWLREQIEAGAYTPNDQLPSENELGERFGISRITVRRALQTLENEGFIYRRQGLGSFVRPPQAVQGLVRLTDFAQDMQEAGLEASSRIIHHDQEIAPPAIAEILQLLPETPIIRLDRLRLGDGSPVAFDRTWLPLFYGQLLVGHDLRQVTIYHILEHHYDIPVQRGRYRIEAINAGPELAGLLEVPEGHALLLIERVSLTLGDRRIYFQRRYYRSDRVAYELELARDADRPNATGGMPLRHFEPVFKPGRAT